MRTTLDLDQDVLAAARSLARVERKSLGKMISELVRRALAPRETGTTDRGFPVFRVSEGASPITPEMVREVEEE